MRTVEFDYELPPELIAQTPLEPRDGSRLMVVDRRSGEIAHRHFYALPHFLRPGDLLAHNESRVIPARLFARKWTGQSHLAHPLSLDRQIQTSGRSNLRIWRSEVSKVG